MAKESKQVKELTDLLKSLEKNNRDQAKGLTKLIDISKKQLDSIKSLVTKDFGDFLSNKGNKVIESKDTEEKHTKKMINLQKERDKLSKESINRDIQSLEKKKKMQGDIEKKNTNIIKQEEKLAKMKRPESNRLGGIVNQQFGRIKNITSSPDKLGVPGRDVSIAKFATKAEQTETRNKEEAERANLMIEKLDEIAQNTEREKKMLKGDNKGMLGKIGKMLGFLFRPIASLLGLLFSPIKAMGKGVGALLGKGVGAMAPAASSLMRVVGKTALLGGVVWMLSDFISGFNKAGVKGGIGKMFLGDVDGTLQSTFKNAGKWAMVGAGIGSVVPVVGTIAGGIIGGSVGLLLNYVANLVKSPGDVGGKVKDFFFGGSGGVLSALFNGSKYAAMGALVGSVFPVVGTIAGGAIGFAVGFLINFVKQILPGDVKKGVTKIFSAVGRGLVSAWNWISEKTTSIFEWGKSTMISMWENIKGLFSIAWEGFKNMLMLPIRIIDWIAEKLGFKEEWENFKGFISEKAGGIWTGITGFFSNIFDTVTQFFSDIKDSFKNVMGDYWKRIKGFFSFGDDDVEKNIKNKAGKATNFEKGVKGIAKGATGILKEGMSTGGQIISSAGKALSGVGGSMSTSGGAPSGPISVKYNKQYHTELIRQKEHLSTIAEKSTLLFDVTQKIMTHLSNIEMFLKNDAISRMSEMFSDQMQKMANTLRNINEDNRRWDFMSATGSMEGYSSKYSKYAQELKNLSDDPNKMKQYKDSINQVSNVNSNVTNIFTDSTIATLRQ
jgi:hypothetical protein